MKKTLILFLMLCCYCALNADQMFVFMTPILPGKTTVLKESAFLNSDEEAAYFNNIGIVQYHRWIQKIHNENFLIHLLKGPDLKTSLKRMQARTSQQALQLHQLYLDALGLDFEQENAIPFTYELTDMLTVEMENDTPSLHKEYCFIYPILPIKKDTLLLMFQNRAEYFNQQAQDIYRYRGISRQQLWIQDNPTMPYLLIYQEIADVIRAREKYLNSKADAFSKRKSQEFSNATGLSFEELLPQLESLFDGEILK